MTQQTQDKVNSEEQNNNPEQPAPENPENEEVAVVVDQEPTSQPEESDNFDSIQSGIEHTINELETIDINKLSETGLKIYSTKALEALKVVHEYLKDNNTQISHQEALKEIARLKELVAFRTAEIENTRARLTKDFDNRLKYATTPLLKDLIPTIENLDAALEHIPESKEDNDPAINSFIDGVKLTHKQFLTVLSKYKIKQLGEVGETFDPLIHDCLAYSPSPAPENQVIYVQTKGYSLEGRVITAPKVVVSKGLDNPTE